MAGGASGTAPPVPFPGCEDRIGRSRSAAAEADGLLGSGHLVLAIAGNVSDPRLAAFEEVARIDLLLLRRRLDGGGAWPA